MKLIKMSLFILLLNACGQSEEMWGGSSAKGDGDAVLGTQCDEVNSEDKGMICTGQLQSTWVPHLWTKCPCTYEGHNVLKVGPFDCNRCSTVAETEASKAITERAQCEEIDKTVGPFTCTALEALVVVPHMWAVNDDSLLCTKTHGDLTFSVTDGATWPDSPGVGSIPIAKCNPDRNMLMFGF